MADGTVVLIPLKSFSGGKSRLAATLPAPQREELTRACAQRVLRAAGALPVVVLTRDTPVFDWARQEGADVLHDTGRDLNSALTAAVPHLRERGHRRIVIAHADLPLADDLTWVVELPGIVLVPDRRDDGTNVLAVPTETEFRFSYGKASSHHHDGEAWRTGETTTIVRDPLLGWDLDIPEDLELPSGGHLAQLQAASLRVRQRALDGPLPRRLRRIA